MPFSGIGQPSNPRVGPPQPSTVYSVDSLPVNNPKRQRELEPMQMQFGDNNRGRKNDNQYKANDKTNKRTWGRSEKKKFKPNKYTDLTRDLNTKKPYLIVPPINPGKPGVAVQPSKGTGFGYDIGGSPTPTTIDMTRDSTLFKDWNRKPVVNAPDNENADNLLNSYMKVLDISFNTNIDDEAYDSEWRVIFNEIYRDIIRNTNASKGAIAGTEIDKITEYVHEVSRLFAILYQYEVITSWNPNNIEEFNMCNREIAQMLSKVEFLDFRTKMRECLRTCVLPQKTMMYLRWLFEYKRKNEILESDTLAFRTPNIMKLIKGVVENNLPEIENWENTIDASITAIRGLDPKIGPILEDKVDCVNFVPCKDFMGNAHNTASYDVEWNNIYRNRTFGSKGAGSTSMTTFPSGLDAQIASSTVTPYGLSLANLSTQILTKSACLPLEGTGVSTPDFTGVTSYTHYYYNFSTAGALTLSPVRYWFESGDDSTFVYDNQIPGGIVIPKGATVNMYYPAQNNIGMAKRYSFQQLFIN